jgi:hypothetical protein
MGGFAFWIENIGRMRYSIIKEFKSNGCYRLQILIFKEIEYMGSDPPIGLTPYEKAQNSGEIKSSGILYSNKGEESAKEIREILPSPDRVEVSGKVDFTESRTTYHLTGNNNLNEYILMMNQAAQIKVETETSSSISLNENIHNSLLYKSGCDIRA